MEVTGINAQSFKAINMNRAVSQTLYGRRISGKSIKTMNELSINQLNNPYDVIFNKNIFGSLKAKIKAPNGDIMYKGSENFYEGLINSDPIKFIQKVCERANSLKEQIQL